MKEHLETIDQVIEKLGGSRAVAEITGRGTSISMVPSWRYRKRFPAQSYKRMQDALEERGFSAPDSLWGM